MNNPTVKILKFSKADLSILGQNNISIVDNYEAKGLSMNPSEDSRGSFELEIPFKIQTTKNTIPNINDEEFCTVVRSKIDVSEVHANQMVATKTGEDFGSSDFSKKRVRSPLQQNRMFTELKDSNG